MKIYSNKKRDEVAHRFKKGQKVKKDGKEYTVGEIDAWSSDEIYLVLESSDLGNEFLIVEAKELR